MDIKELSRRKIAAAEEAKIRQRLATVFELATAVIFVTPDGKVNTLSTEARENVAKALRGK